MKLTEMQKFMECTVAFNIGGALCCNTCFGRYIGYTPPSDNDPQVAAIEVEVQGMPSLYKITENEIEKLTIYHSSINYSRMKK